MTSYSITLSTPNHALLTVGPFMPSGSNPERITITGTDGLLEDRMYTVSVEARNQFGRTFSKERTFCKLLTFFSSCTRLPVPLQLKTQLVVARSSCHIMDSSKWCEYSQS